MTNAVILGLLRSPLGRLVGGLCELEFTGRSGRAVRLPVQHARDGDQVVVHVGHTAGKQWWRKFTDPHPAAERLPGQSLVKIAVGTKVVSEATGASPGPAAATVRTALRLIDGLAIHLRAARRHRVQAASNARAGTTLHRVDRVVVTHPPVPASPTRIR
jgi:hypothetical protein